MKNEITKREVMEYLEAIIKVTDLGGLKNDSEKLLNSLKATDDEMDSLQMTKFNIFKSQYLKEQREWETKNGLGHRVSRYTD